MNEAPVTTAMEERKTTSEYLYEDDFAYVTKDSELFLKGSIRMEERKLADVEEDGIEEKIGALKHTFADLQQKVASLSAQEDIRKDEVDEIREEILNTEAIGDFDALLGKIETMRSAEELQEAHDDASQVAAQKDPESPVEKKVEIPDGEKILDDLGQGEEPAEENEANPLDYYKDIVKKAETLSNQTDWPYVAQELDVLSHRWSEGPDVESDGIKKLFQKFTRYAEKFEEKKEAHYQQQKQQRQNNAVAKKKLLDELKEIVDKKNWSATGKISKIKNRWNSIGSLPSGEGEKPDDEFEKLISIFNEHKVDRLVQQRQKEEDNLMLKLIILDKMEMIVSSIDETTKDWKKVDDEFDDLTLQWKKIGRVPKEKANGVWQRYKNAQDGYYDSKYKFDKKHRSRIDKFRSKKEKLCKQAEVLLDADDLASAARKINKLHRRWKKIGNLPQRDEDDLWARFKSATDSFNDRKSDNSDLLRKQEEQHFQQKLQLIEEAEVIKNTEDWDEGHKKMQGLMDRWKAIGPVPRKKSNKIWKQFKGAMDVFYDRRREHFKDIKEERKENLKDKQGILDKLRDLGQHEDPVEAVNIAKDLQTRFKEAGYVPINKKNKIWKQYRKACDVIYDRFRAAKSGDKFDQELAKADLDVNQREQIQDMRKQYKKIRKEVRQLEEEVLQFQETKTYFKPTDKGSALRDEIQQKIDKAENKLQVKQDELDELTRKMEDIKADS